MVGEIVLVAGATGFLGNAVCAELERRGNTVVRYSRKSRHVPTKADAIVNCIGIIKGSYHDFHDAHIHMTEWLLSLGKKLSISQFVQISALGVDELETTYQQTKMAGEDIVEQSGLPYVIIRPSMLFGKNDKSINVFKGIARTGLLPILGSGKMQPIAVETVAKVVAACVEKRLKNSVVELGGPEIFTPEELADRIHPGVHTFRVPKFFRIFIVPFSFLPAVPSWDMLRMLDMDNTTTEKSVERLGIENPHLR